MKNSFSKIVLVATVTCSLAMPMVALANEETVSPSSTSTPRPRETLHEQVQEAREQFHEVKETVKAEVKEAHDRLSDERRLAITQAFSDIKNRFQNAFNRMKDIADKMAAKSVELASKGADMSVVNTLISTGKSKLESVPALLITAESQFQALADATDRKVAFEAFKGSVKLIGEALKDAHDSLKDAAEKMRAMYQTLSPTASSTATPRA